jgi:ABC-type nitrate/sulfonate/bicarbonate transport system ATPase subunit
MTVPRLQVTDVSVSYPERKARKHVVSDVSLAAERGEFISIIGPSGCGKSTLFNVIAGLLEPDSGTVLIDGVDVTGDTTHFAYMPQKDLLQPWRNVLDNTILGLEIQGVGKREARRRARELFPQFGLAGTENARPSALSGGMRQRAALLRTVLMGREILLLDEPFGALDSLTRKKMQDWLSQLLAERELTVVLVTHDIDEAILLSDRIYVMGPRPTSIAYAFDNPQARPRTVASAEAPEFLELRRMLLDSLVPTKDAHND